jgi:hypothetical protein
VLISVTLNSIVWIGLFHPLGETWISTRLTRYTIVKNQLGHINWEPWTAQRDAVDSNPVNDRVSAA